MPVLTTSITGDKNKKNYHILVTFYVVFRAVFIGDKLNGFQQV